MHCTMYLYVEQPHLDAQTLFLCDGLAVCHLQRGVLLLQLPCLRLGALRALSRLPERIRQRLALAKQRVLFFFTMCSRTYGGFRCGIAHIEAVRLSEGQLVGDTSGWYNCVGWLGFVESKIGSAFRAWKATQ